ncbi:zinc ABC transporter ATP-binding protein AztA [Conyzicola nivalis]|uniref:ABC transporter ATPase n=1 Tax=Conyzicola nivalis TaxID=1477021 RepID=A0A916SK54_9MICO|nr:zinc ABC transporter ATP-binding protein AztA [Conyzicola nivalis]GGB04172.1 ABC transporter ATPase [Conyzicola nivalis]
MIELQNISVEHGGIRALNSVSVSIAAGEITALAGQNGSGKSTLLGVIAGTQEHRGIAERRAGARIAFVVQRSAVPHSLPLTVHEVVSMGRWAHRAPWRPLTRTDREIVADSVAALGLQALERRPLHELSGGQRQRALVAQGLAQRAEILLLDEPAAALDDEARGLIDLAIAREARRGAAVVHATHDAAVIVAADRVIRLDAGRLVAS